MRRHAKAASAETTPQGEKSASAGRTRNFGIALLLAGILASAAIAAPASADELPTDVFAAYAAPRTDTTARLNGYVNPKNTEATYRFQYSLDGVDWTTLPDLKTRLANRQIVVGQEVAGLQPETLYHYRFTVENEAGSVQSDELTFETRSTAEMQMPQRGIELVNPPNKGNQNIAPEESTKTMWVSRDGQRVLWKVLAGTPDGTTGTEVNFLSTRTASGWESHPIAPPAAEQVGEGGYTYKFNMATPDLRHFLVRVMLTDLANDGVPTIVRLDDQQHQDVLKEFTQSKPEGYENADMTDDGAHVIMANHESEQLEEISAEPHEVVSIMPDGQPAECGVHPGSFSGPGGASPASAHFQYAVTHRMATTDASRLYFQAFPNGGSCTASPGHYEAIYFRDRNTDQTIEIDDGTAGALNHKPGLIRASRDGRSVAFVTAAVHSPDDENTTPDVYRWDADTENYTCLTCMVAEASPSINGGGSALAKIVVSDDFSHVYFTSTNQLVPGRGMPGETSLYAASDGKVNYVSPAIPGTLGEGATIGSRLSSDGNVLLFATGHSQSYTRLTADEQADECKIPVVLFFELEPNCRELFRYEDSTNSLECLSCRPGGVTTHDIVENDNSIAALSPDGSTVAFVTHEPLLPQDINSGFDVYEWHNGGLQLITDGETFYPPGTGTLPRVFGMSDSADDIFFTVVQPGLTGYEQDNLANLYDARVGGGFPRPTETPRCSEESCQGPLAPAPPVQPTGSSAFTGAGNEVTATKKRGRCAVKRGKARRRCLQAKRRKQKRQAAKRRASQRSDRGTK